MAATVIATIVICAYVFGGSALCLYKTMSMKKSNDHENVLLN